ncbi:bifunctional hydroxymethylpyrimidine kinase/phosphomethylpyrimidine kinase [Enterobacter hormaechei]
MRCSAMGCRAVLMKGGHLDDAESPDWLFTHDGAQRFTAPRVQTKNTHGTAVRSRRRWRRCVPKRELGGYGAGGEDLALGRAGKSRFSGSGSRYWAGSPFSCMVVSRILA